MAITVRDDGVQVSAGQEHGSEDIFQLRTDLGGTIHCVLTSGPGAATPVGSLEERPAALTNFADIKGDGDQTATFLFSFGPGQGPRHFALDINSSSGGTWTVYVSQPDLTY